MTWLQIIAQAGVIASIVSVGIAVAAYFNGKHIKEEERLTREILKEMRQEVVELLKEMRQEVVKLLKKGFGEVLAKGR